MPRPTPAQLAYGSATVVFSTLAMLLLSQTRSALGVGIVTVAGLALGLLVAVTVPVSRTSRTSRASRPSRTIRANRPMARTGPAERPRAHAPAREHSLHG
ncbi:hypothetical protein ABZS86_07570 [Streptomyces sp. NPDC005355]|uniref:hypothetical protein n=1 Tax=Streptomyces sp. NPDC005355 TaxID=3157038 RepID=UPI0033B55371